MTAAQEILSKPHKFIRRNLLFLNAALDNPRPEIVRRDGTVLVKLRDGTADITLFGGEISRVRNRKGLKRFVSKSNKSHWEKDCSIFYIEPAADGDADSFPAYICPYADNTTSVAMLGGDARLMFTGNMDGCSFGAGIPNKAGGVRVAHSNAKNLAVGTNDDPDYRPQIAGQRAGLVAEGTTRVTLEPPQYRSPNSAIANWKATTIGIRENGQWEFWYQHQEGGGSFMRMMSVTKLR